MYLIYVCVCVCVFCTFVGLDNELYKMHGTYIKILLQALSLFIKILAASVFQHDWETRQFKTYQKLTRESKFLDMARVMIRNW